MASKRETETRSKEREREDDDDDDAGRDRDSLDCTLQESVQRREGHGQGGERHMRTIRA